MKLRKRKLQEQSKSSPARKTKRHAKTEVKIEGELKAERASTPKRAKRKRKLKCRKKGAKKKSITSPFFSILPKNFPKGWRFPVGVDCNDLLSK